ncbi:peptide chain release factor 3 [Rubrobacter aplysinae]|uniref:peptide chain release factor 3 n=1 Tax=Rubrobacter aplysinae TaxID=909625 RepID=UPI00069D8ECC|nr:peptide chain release factor 3 [Rubrobacter aplysinae]
MEQTNAAASSGAGTHAGSRRTFAIISHPDAGKTTLTEKFLLYSGAINMAGAVKSRKQAAARSDWMELEKQRGISITSTVLGLSYDGYRMNLLDTPGHKDFSEDTYRTLYAADCALMVLDAAKGLEPQTLKLFEVCRMRGLPIITFVNKLDRPSMEPLELTDQIEQTLGLATAPVTWPVGNGQDFTGVIDRRSGSLHRYDRAGQGSTEAGEEELSSQEAREQLGGGEFYEAALEELSLLDEVGAPREVDDGGSARERFLAGELTPVFFGSALSNFGVRLLLEEITTLAPAPGPRGDAEGQPRELGDPFSGQVFKVQANMDPRHRDRVAFVRVHSGRFQRGESLTHAPTGKPVSTRHAQQLFAEERSTVEEAVPGDIVGLVNAAGLGVGDTVYAGPPVSFPAIPEFEPEHFLIARNKDSAKYKQFRNGLKQLAEEGAIKILSRTHDGGQEPVLAAVGPLQFQVAEHRMEHEFGAPLSTRSSPFAACRLIDEEQAEALDGRRGVEVARDLRGTPFALFESRYWLGQAEEALGHGIGVYRS